IPVDGPSAGVPLAVAIYSALTRIPVRGTMAMTGEVSVQGLVKPVGGIAAKIEAARHAGADTVLIPADNHEEIYDRSEGIRVLPVSHLSEALRHALVGDAADRGADRRPEQPSGLVAALNPR
ncbi:MAG TPA: S16 family serine protease, partial [Bacillota bacterium]